MGGGGREAAMVPEADFTSYHGRIIVKPALIGALASVGLLVFDLAGRRGSSPGDDDVS